MKLFDDEADNGNDDLSKIEINKEYARRFEHNKKREDLQRYEEMKKRGQVEESDEDDSSSDDDDDEDIIDQSTKDDDFFKALLRVRSRDPRLREKDVKLFESDDDDESDEREEESERKEKKDKKSMYLKDVVAKHLIEEGPDFEEHDLKVKTYNQEQEEIKKAFLDATEEFDNEDDGDFLRVKGENDKDDEEKEDSNDGEFSKKLEEYFGEDAEVDENTKFLKEFFKNKLWIDKEKKGGDLEVDDEVVDELLKDEEEIERQEGYELEYNFRHEENADDRVMGYSRRVEGTVRKKESKRKEQRERKEERMRVAEMERKEELKHLKNLKKEEIKERMKKVMEIAGIKKEDCPFSAKDLEEEFDPEEYDKMMKAVFDKEYYEDEDLEINSDSDGIEKPDFDKEDELLGLPKGWDVLESHDGFLAARERNKQKLESGGGNDSGEDEENGEEEVEDEDKEDDDEGEGKEHESEDEENGEERKEEETEEGKRKRKRKMSAVQKALQEIWEEFYSLDYEDTIGDLKTRFKYVKIKPNRYGLKPNELLALDEKELNQYVSLKKLAPYTDKEWKVPDSKRYQQKMRIKELLREKPSGHKIGKKRSRDATTPEQPKEEDKQGKKKRRQATNMSESRRKAYGMISSKPKKKKHKH